MCSCVCASMLNRCWCIRCTWEHTWEQRLEVNARCLHRLFSVSLLFETGTITKPGGEGLDSATSLAIGLQGCSCLQYRSYRPRLWVRLFTYSISQLYALSPILLFSGSPPLPKIAEETVVLKVRILKAILFASRGFTTQNPGARLHGMTHHSKRGPPGVYVAETLIRSVLKMHRESTVGFRVREQCRVTSEIGAHTVISRSWDLDETRWWTARLVSN